jgi:hypothetical protein
LAHCFRTAYRSLAPDSGPSWPGAQGTQAVDDVCLGPDQVLALRVGRGLEIDVCQTDTQVTELARSRTPGGRLLTTADCVGATLFLLDNQGMNGENLAVDAGILLT